MADHRHAWRADTTQVGSVCYDCGLTQHDWFFDEQRRLAAEVERLRTDLGIYGDHLDSCWLKQSPRVEVVGQSRCNCGYFAAVGKGLAGSKE